MSAEQRLQELGIVLPAAPVPVANYVPAVRTGNLLYVSGQACVVDGEMKYTGKVGKELTLEQGYEAARIAAINTLAIVKQELGSLDRVKRVVKLLGFVASDLNFFEQPKVINGASDFFAEIFGDSGRHARSALGTNVLPFNTPVEIEVIFEIE
ncbi:endoribonuclease L-PSP [Thermincola ferriacetica]|uniref:Endoribonuclease L-PSP n=2 Tax=Thermincola TaxID=278993 RepID=D5X9X0_THEPJ|nr:MULTISPECIES: RidA family protein [Thermincola]ADG83103.1 Endoribonuclease L-PSP [Thermincola potens JR]KNZ70590.1 endoribonuclease L-PSP [Thermincola ferriacetica]